MEYILDRTFFRPREAIIYLNECIKRALGSSRITVSVLTQTEVAYSQQRLKSLGVEWKREYPNLEIATKFFEHRKTQFRIDEITSEEAKAFAVSVLEAPTQLKDPIYDACEKYYLEDKLSLLEFMREIVAIFYHVGLCGVKPDAHLGRQWS